EESVLETVDARGDGFTIANRAEVPGDLEPPAMSGFGDRLQVFPADLGVNLEPRRPFIGPVFDDSPRLLGRRDVSPLDDGIGTGQIGTADVHSRPGNRSGIDLLLEADLGVRRNAAGGPDARDPAAEVEPRGADVELRAPAGCRSVKRVIVHPHEA